MIRAPDQSDDIYGDRHEEKNSKDGIHGCDACAERADIEEVDSRRNKNSCRYEKPDRAVLQIEVTRLIRYAFCSLCLREILLYSDSR